MVLAQDGLSMCMVELCDKKNNIKKKMERVSLKTNLGRVEGEKILRF